jgi:predicted HNH restriction endonuclease
MSDYLKYRQQLKLGIKPAPQAEGKAGKETDGEKGGGKDKAGKVAKKGGKAKIKTATKKRAKQNRAYTKVKKKFLVDHPTCMAQLDGCTGQSTDLHHIGGRTGENLLKVEDFAALCRNCHNIIHRKMSADQAKKLGLKK